MKTTKRPHRLQRKSGGLLAGDRPASAYYGTDSYETARENGDASPDGKRLGFDGAEPGTGPRGTAPDSPALEPWDDLPPIDRP